MPPKRDAGETATPTPLKMLKIATDAQEFGCDAVEEKYRLAEECSYSPFPGNQVSCARPHVLLCNNNNTWLLLMGSLLYYFFLAA